MNPISAQVRKWGWGRIFVWSNLLCTRIRKFPNSLSEIDTLSLHNFWCRNNQAKRKYVLDRRDATLSRSYSQAFSWGRDWDAEVLTKSIITDEHYNVKNIKMQGKHVLQIEHWPHHSIPITHNQHIRVKDGTGYSGCFERLSHSSSLWNYSYFSHLQIAFFPARNDQNVTFSLQ